MRTWVLFWPETGQPMGNFVFVSEAHKYIVRQELLQSVSR